MVARFSSLFVGVGWQETLLELWDWLGSPATVRVMGLVTGRVPPGPTYTLSDNDKHSVWMRDVNVSTSCVLSARLAFLFSLVRKVRGEAKNHNRTEQPTKHKNRRAKIRDEGDV